MRKAAGLILDEGKSLAEAATVLNSLGMLPRGSLRMIEGHTVNVPATWSLQLLRRHLTRPTLYGEVFWGNGRFATRKKDGSLVYGDGVLIPGVPPVLTRERWEAMQERVHRARPDPGLRHGLPAHAAYRAQVRQPAHRH